ncbi:hypothetical protein M413DRAFT_443181 [Hebeloma cylindrosporum]|uniref:Uncharacterized protein n=1 Tax=Hebeloma cylindrosporum TaxID=76867 RepID=A0A0C2YT35_HEBCY|nr:hypothetical protein M413DRAFT_443181 [Hebeloma cylindrosporum h7]
MIDISKQYPFTIAQSATEITNISVLLASILAAGSLDELSNIENFTSVETYIRRRGHVDSQTGKLQSGVMFWLYPTGLHGPYHETQEGEIAHHGTLITIEPGVSFEDAFEKAKDGLRLSGIGHLHIAEA